MSHPPIRRPVMLALPLALALLAGCGPSRVASSTTPAPSAIALEALPDDDLAAELRAWCEQHIVLLESRDEARVRALFVADERFAWYTDGALSYASADDVLAGMRRFAGMTFSTRLSDVTVVPLTDGLASVRSAFRTTLTIPGQDDVSYGGVITWLLEKQGGDWRVLLGHTSTPSPWAGGSGRSGSDSKQAGPAEETGETG